MSGFTKIEWTQATWNPTRGCSPVSPGCENCYAVRFARRFSGAGKPYEGLTESTPEGPVWTGRIRLVEEALDLPLRWRVPRHVFVDSMSDLFHERIPVDFIQKVFRTMGEASWHTFQVLTKRAARLHQLRSVLPWPRNVWIGISIESSEYAWRAGILRDVPGAIRFLSIEPLLGPIPNIALDGIHWVIVGGESGPGARPMDVDWVRQLRDDCNESGVPFFFKQWGGVHKSKNGRILDGQIWEEMPVHIPKATSTDSCLIGPRCRSANA